MHPVKTQISLGICLVWSEFLLSAWRTLESLATYWAHREDSCQTWRMADMSLCRVHRSFYWFCHVQAPFVVSVVFYIAVVISICNYVPNFEVEGAYWFWPVCLSVTLGYGLESVEIRSWNCIYRTSMKNKGTRIFYFLGRTCCCRVMPLLLLMQCKPMEPCK